MAPESEANRARLTQVFELGDLDATRRFGKTLGQLLGAHSVVGLTGDMGAGKTTLSRGIAEGFGVLDIGEVTSPTYAWAHVYAAQAGVMIHLDLWRLDDVAQAQALGLDEYITQNNALVVVEWADKALELLPDDAVWLDLSYVSASRRRASLRHARSDLIGALQSFVAAT